MVVKALFILSGLGLALVGLVWWGVVCLPPAPAAIPPLPPEEVSIPPAGNHPQPDEADAGVATGRVLAVLKAALQAGDWAAAASCFDPLGNERVRDMAARVAGPGGCAALLGFWREASLADMKEVDYSCRGRLRAGPGGRRPWRIVFSLDSRDRWLIRAIRPLSQD